MKVLVAIMEQGWINTKLARYLLRLSVDKRHELEIRFYNARPIEHNKQLIVDDFLNSSADFLLKIDDDITLARDPLDLVEYNRDIIGCPVLGHQAGEFGFLALKRVAPRQYFNVPVEERIGLSEVDVVSDGCMLIARRVFEKIPAPFMRVWEDGHAILGSDFAFCERVHEAGYKVWTHWDYVCGQVLELNNIEIKLWQ